MQKSQKQIKKKQAKSVSTKEVPKQKQQKNQMPKPEKDPKTQQKKASPQQKQQKKEGISQKAEKVQKAEKTQKTKKQQASQKTVISNECIEIVLDEKLLQPSNQNISMSKTLEMAKLSSLKLWKTVNSLMQNQSSVFVKPIYIRNEGEKDILVLYTVEGITKYRDIQLHLQDQIIFRWLVQVLFQLHPFNFGNDAAFPKISKSNLYLADSPFLQMAILREEKYFWQNPMKVLITEQVKEQKQYFEQMHDFNEEFKKIKTFQDVQQLYYKITIGEYASQFLCIQNIANKLKISAPTHNQEINSLPSGFLSPENNNWLAKQVGMSQKNTFLFCFKGSSVDFNPEKFWPKVKQQIKPENCPSLLILKIQTISGLDKLIGFYSILFGLNTSMSSNMFSEYIEDKQKKSLLINFDQRTVHHLKEQKYAFTFNKQILLSIGKCDIVLSAFNITNLCYFPTSFEPDTEGNCTNADILCGGKKFILKEVQFYTMKPKNQ